MMQATNHLALIALVCDLLLGGAVFLVNPKRPTNRSFLLLSLTFALWLAAMIVALVSKAPATVAFGIGLCSFAGAFCVPTMALLRTSIVYHRETWGQHFRRLRWLFAAASAVAIFCLTPYFIAFVKMEPVPGGRGTTPMPVYGWHGWAAAPLFGFLLGSFVLLIVQLVRDQFDRRINGVQRVELQFFLLAYVVTVANFFVNRVINMFTSTEHLGSYTPLRIVAFGVVIAYGVTSRGILNVRSALRLGLSYLLLAGYAGSVFIAAWFLIGLGLWYAGFQADFVQALIAGVLVAMLVNSTGTPLRRIARKILPAPDVDFEKTVAAVGHIVQSVSTFSDLINEFSSVLRRAVGTPYVGVFIAQGDGFYEQTAEGTPGEWMPFDDVVLAAVRGGAPDVTAEDLLRRAPGAEREALLTRMQTLGADLVLPIRYHGKLSGLLVMGPRVSGRVYGLTGRETLRLIAEQLGIAVANSRLYTEARQSQAYNQFLVEHLSCGVIATDPAGNLTVVNPEARRLLHLDELAPPADLELVPDIARLIPPTLAGDVMAHDEEIVLRLGARDQANLRVSCLPFASERQELLGAVLVINDHTTLEHLQRQVRQADRLASIGTLASGMAHEIKNPLTALKTFTQLLPKRYHDAEFRDDFSGLAGSEIARIERIVNQLLAFARPAPLMIEQVSLHEVVDNAVRLVSPQAARSNVKVCKTLTAGSDFIAADKDRLQQVLLNLLLNAMQASHEGGSVEVITEAEPINAEHEVFVRMDVRDNGGGIPPDKLPHIFDPFFTTKSEGTGLGLSVSYNIIAEHRGRLEVRSELGQGTCFSVYLPAC